MNEYGKKRDLAYRWSLIFFHAAKLKEGFFMITKIRKRDGREIYFAPEKITRAIFLAASKVAEDEGQVADYATAEQLTDQVVNYLNRHFQDEIPNVEEIQDAVV